MTRCSTTCRLVLRQGETVGLVGESGSGKTVTSLVDHGPGGRLGRHASPRGSIRLRGHRADRRAASDSGGTVRGRRIAMIFQQPTRGLNPAFTVGDQIAEAARLHLGVDRKAGVDSGPSSRSTACSIPPPQRRARDYPHTFSGGMASGS